jgi:hypothetical protein
MRQNIKNSEDKQLLRVLKRGLRALHPEDLVSGSACPDSWTLASYVTGELHPRTQQAVNVHMAFCDRCLEDYVALAGPEKIAEILSQEIWQRKPLEADLQAAKIFEIAKKHEAERVERRSYRLKKSMKRAVEKAQAVVTKVLVVGKNTYTVDVSMNAGRAICTVAGLRTPAKIPLKISVRSETGTEVISTRTDDSGNAQFVLPGAPGERRVVSVEVAGQKLHRQFTIDENLKLH